MKFDVFLSHNSKDKPLVEQIAHLLDGKGIKVWLDKWNLIPGDPWQEDLEEALDESQTIAVFVGPHDISPWENEEMRSAIEERVRDKKRRVIPVLLPGAPHNKTLKLPRFLRRLTWVDLRTGINDEDGFHRLLVSGINGLPPGKTSNKNISSDAETSHPIDLPFGSYLPFPRNGNFTGRTSDLEKLAEALLGEDQIDVVVNQTITGMGGLGKTQLAVEFAYEYGHKFQGVHWLDLREAQSLDEQIVLCGEKMGLLNWPPTLPEQVTATMREWLQNYPRLLILDNFEEPESVNEVLAKLAEHLGRLPLGLELAGRYLEKQPRLRIEAYLVQLEKALDHRSMQNWKSEIKSLTEHDLSLLQTFARSWELVQDTKAQKLFIASGYCAPNTPIPTRMHELVLGEDEKEACDECLADLVGLGLLKVGPSIHPLLAQFARKLDTENSVLAPFCEGFAELAIQTNHEVDRTGNYSLYSSILPHVRTAAGFAETAVIEPAGKLWNSLGYHIKTLADYAGAKAAYERALKILEMYFSPDHPNIRIVRGNLESL